jgi:hypothetical protein
MNVTLPADARSVDLAQAAHDAAQQVGIRLSEFHYPKGRGIAFTLKTEGPRPRYRRYNTNGRTVPGRVCWHGTRDFLRALYSRVPEAKVRTAMATYKNAADFERSYGATYYRQSEYMGFMMQAPVNQPCACAE